MEMETVKNEQSIVYFQVDSRVYLGKVGKNAYQDPIFVFALNKCGTLTTTQSRLSTERVFTLPLAESDYDALHRVIDSQDCSRRFSFCIGYAIQESKSVLFSADEIHITFPFPSPTKDNVTAFVCSDKVTAEVAGILC